MAVHIRLKRLGRRKRPFYRIVVMDSHTRRDGREIERLGWYDPIKTDNTLSIKEDRVIFWLKKGAQPTDTVRSFLKHTGINLKWHLIKAGKTDAEIATAVAEWQDRKQLKAENNKPDSILDAPEESVSEELVEEVETSAEPIEES